MTRCRFCSNKAEILYHFRRTETVKVCFPCLNQIISNGRILPAQVETRGDRIDSFWYVAAPNYNIYHLAAPDVGTKGIYAMLCHRLPVSVAVAYPEPPKGKALCGKCQTQLEMGR